jgi:hypothetical protein
MKVKVFIIVILLIVIGVLLSIVIKPAQGPLVLEPTKSIRAMRILFDNLIQKEGKEKAYKLVIVAADKKDYREQHLILHVFGEQLFRKFGVSAVAVCDATYGHGCFHGFFNDAVSEKGLEILPELDRACLSKSQTDIECQHGIGHGILTRLGHNSVVEASKICGQLSSEQGAFSCRDGVFMEYHFETIVNGDKVRYSAQSVQPDPYDPCAKLPQEEQAACFGNLPEWWFTDVSQTPPRKAAELCEAVQNRANKISCLISVGYYVPPAFVYDVNKSVASCNEMPSEESKTICKTFSFQSFMRKGYKDKAEMMCKPTLGAIDSCANRKKYYKEIGLNYD